MKISKTTVIFLLIGIIVILAAGMGMAYTRYDREQSLLNEEIALAQLRLNKYPAQELASQKEDAQSRLAQAESQLSIAKASLHQSIESIEASNVIFDLAEECYVEVTEIQSPGIATHKIGEVELSFLPITVTIEGEVLNFNDFVYKWTQEYPTGVVESVEITVPEPPSEEEIAKAEEAGEEIEEEKPSAVIKLLIHNYGGD